ncbi:hypothetical protein CRENBAI_010335, partial [Crenichthys baileyi]
MNLLTFLYETDFQLSSSSGNGREEKKGSPASFSLSRYAPPMRLPMRHAGNGNESLFSTGFIIPGDSRAATSVELRMSNCLTKMDDPNTTLVPKAFQGFKERLVLVLASGPVSSAPAYEGPIDSAPAYEGPIDSAPASEGLPLPVPASRSSSSPAAKVSTPLQASLSSPSLPLPPAQVFVDVPAAGCPGSYISATLLVFVDVATGSRQGLYVADPGSRLNFVPARDNLLVARLNFV